MAKKVFQRMALMAYGEGYEGRWRYKESTMDRAVCFFMGHRCCRKGRCR